MWDWTIMSESNFGDLCILTDSRCSIQHLTNSTYVGDKTSLSILQQLKLISLQHDAHFRWIPPHVDIHGNELADNLAKGGLKSSHPLLSRDYFPRTIFAEESPKQCRVAGASLSPLVQRKKAGTFPISSMRQAVQYLSFTACHLNCLTYPEGNKIYPLFPKCQHHLNTFWTVSDLTGRKFILLPF
ncbi:hypothetical protein AVEN_81930-1 [Araneus ventricosus]|uniref:RNase H type-1 domain-containing protein n=1 Tax=Araneus ventricosus TaxID=182803 RepID=A0A4Y2GKV4_ARAVE|nr:hypothetical protein AVEN_81930-1 [Araneus ventricosus]